MRPDVVHVGSDITGGDTGGIASVIRTLVATSPVPAIAVPTYWGRRVRPVLLVRSLRTMLRAPRDAVVHCHLSERGSWLREGGFALVAHHSGRVVAVTLHGALLQEWMGAHRWARAWVAFVLRRASVVFVLHEADARLVRPLSPQPVVVIANPVGLSAAPAGPPHDRRAPTVLFLGVRSRRKGLDVLAEAWPQVLARCPEARLVVAGPPGDAAVNGPAVETVGALTPEQCRELMRSATVVALPSRAEALPMVLLEAMAEGVAFVASAIAGIPRLAASGAGLLVPPGDPDALARALTRLLRDPALRADAASAGPRWVRAHADPHAIHEVLQAAYGGRAQDDRSGLRTAIRRPSPRRMEAS